MNLVVGRRAGCAARAASSGEAAPLRPTDARLDAGHDALVLETCRSHRRCDLSSDGGYAPRHDPRLSVGLTAASGTSMPALNPRP